MPMPTFTLRLSRSVSHYLLPDIRALLPAESVQFFSNELDEEWHYTLLCGQSPENCSLAVSIILIWYQLKHINKLIFCGTTLQADASGCTLGELFELLKKPGAVLYLS